MPSDFTKSGAMGVPDEIEVSVPDGVPERVERVVTENCATLKFDAHSFEES